MPFSIYQSSAYVFIPPTQMTECTERILLYNAADNKSSKAARIFDRKSTIQNFLAEYK